MPELPFSLFDFKRINLFDPIIKKLESAAGVAITTTSLYTVPPHKITWLQAIYGAIQKTTPTALVVGVKHKSLYGPALIKETVGTEAASWPSNKTSAEHVPSWFPFFMYPGDWIYANQALTALETIEHYWTIYRIEYFDPRYEK